MMMRSDENGVMMCDQQILVYHIQLMKRYSSLDPLDSRLAVVDLLGMLIYLDILIVVAWDMEFDSE